MTTVNLKKLLLGSTLLVGFSAANFGAAYAQTSDDDAVEQITTVDNEEEKTDEIVVTGSRIKRDTFSSISPIQVLDFETERDNGIIDPVQILQTSEAAAGIQIDSSFAGFVLDNGPGSETINLRGLGAARTLVLLNGRRLAPSGVEGAPAQPSINLLPSSLIQRTEILTDGASSIYGSDAVAGVVNVILRKDFDGLDIRLTTDQALEGAGDDYNIAGSYGVNFDRGFLGFGAEYDFRDSITAADRDIFSGCQTNVEIDENGEIRNNDVGDQIDFNQRFGEGFLTAADGVDNPCVLAGFSSRIFVAGGNGSPGSIYFVPGESNTGIPNFVDQNGPFGLPIDSDNDGVQDFGFQEFNLNGLDSLNQLRDILSEQERYNLAAFGEYTFEGENNITPYFEVVYSRTETNQQTGAPQIFPTVGIDNPFNPCGTSGIDCVQAFEAATLTNPGFLRVFGNNFGGLCAANGIGPEACTPATFGITAQPDGFREVIPVVSIQGDRNFTETSIDQTRIVGGFTADLPQFSFGDFTDWSFEASAAHTISKGASVRTGIREDRLDLALGNSQIAIDSNGDGFPEIVPGDPIAGLAPCEVQAGVSLTADVTDGCVPVNLFAESVLGEVIGDFATQAERDFLIDERSFDTEINQTVLNAYFSGKLFNLPAGSVGAVFGAEYRDETIKSRPNNVASDGLLFGFFSDSGTNANRDIVEAFGEIDIPVAAGLPFAEQIDVNLSGRVLDDSVGGSAAVYAIKAGWRPVTSLLLKGSFGTSFRSPNLREAFLGPQSGFTNVADPCTVPTDAVTTDPITGAQVVNPALDDRDAAILAACVREGIDPLTFGIGTTGVTNIEVFRQGSELSGAPLDNETSEALTLGASFEQPFTDLFDLTVGVNYYDIEIEDQVIAVGTQFAVNECFDVNGVSADRSRFCDLIVRDPTTQGIASANLDFINLTSRSTTGLDFNARLNKEFRAFNQNFDFGLDLRANHLLTSENEILTAGGTFDSDTFEGEFGFPRWTGSLRARLGFGDWSVNWFTRYQSSQTQDEAGIDAFGNAASTNDGTDTVAFSDTCAGPLFGDVNCRDLGEVGDYFLHNVGLRYEHPTDNWGVNVNVTNVFNEDPPLVDGSEVTSVSNVPIGAGFDLFGRRLFVQVRKAF